MLATFAAMGALFLLMASHAHANTPADAATAASVPGIPYMADGPSLLTLSMRALAALLVCAVAGYAVIAMLKGRSGLPSLKRLATARQLQIMEVQPLGGKARLLLVRHGCEQLLLAQSEAGVSLLRCSPLSDAAASVTHAASIQGNGS